MSKNFWSTQHVTGALIVLRILITLAGIIVVVIQSKVEGLEAALPSPLVATATPATTLTPAPGVQPGYGGTIAIGAAGVATTGQDPANNQAGYGWAGGLGYAGNVFPQIIRTSLQDRVTVEGDLAESWSVSADGTTYTFQWRDGVIDHDGNPLTAEDGAYQMLRYIERPNGLSAKRQGCFRAYVKDILDDNGDMLPEPGVEATSPSELIIRLKAPRSASFPAL